MSPQSTSCCQARGPTHPLAPFLLSFSHSSSLSVSLLPLFSSAGDRGRAMTEVSAQVMVIPSRGCSHWPGESIHSSSSRSPSIYSLCSPGPHSCPSRASTVQPHRALVTQVYESGRMVCVNVSLILHLFFFPPPKSLRLHIVFLFLSLFVQAQLFDIVLV